MSEKTGSFNVDAELLRYIADKMVQLHCMDEKMYDYFQEELYYRTEEIEQVKIELAEARALGDLSENDLYWDLKHWKECLEKYTWILKDFLSNAQTLTKQEAEEFRMRLCEEYVHSDKNNRRTLSFSVNTDWLEDGYFHFGFRRDLESFLIQTPQEEWEDKVRKRIDDMAYQMAYIQTYRALNETETAN